MKCPRLPALHSESWRCLPLGTRQFLTRRPINAPKREIELSGKAESKSVSPFCLRTLEICGVSSSWIGNIWKGYFLGHGIGRESPLGLTGRPVFAESAPLRGFWKYRTFQLSFLLIDWSLFPLGTMSPTSLTSTTYNGWAVLVLASRPECVEEILEWQTTESVRSNRFPGWRRDKAARTPRSLQMKACFFSFSSAFASSLYF